MLLGFHDFFSNTWTVAGLNFIDSIDNSQQVVSALKNARKRNKKMILSSSIEKNKLSTHFGVARMPPDYQLLEIILDFRPGGNSSSN